MLIAALSSVVMLTAADPLSSYDVVWTTPSRDASASMPLGNGEVVLNVWVEEATGDLLFYIARTDAISEISRYLKLGRVRLHWASSPFKSRGDFRQHLHLREGFIEVTGGGSSLRVFVDSDRNTIYLEGANAEPDTVTANVECWRNQPRTLPKEEMRSAWSVHDAPFDLVESQDIFKPTADAIVWYHRNETSVVPKLWANQSLSGLRGTHDPLIHRTFGGKLAGEGFTRSGERTLKTAKPVRQFHLWLATHTQVTSTVSEWERGLARQGVRDGNAAKRTRAWWNAFWNRSWVFVHGDHPDFSVPQNDYPFRIGMDSGHGNVFPGQLSSPGILNRPASYEELWKWRGQDEPKPLPNQPTFEDGVSGPPDFRKGLSIAAWIKPEKLAPGRIVDRLTAGRNDGFLFDTHPGDSLRLIVGDIELSAPKCLKVGQKQFVSASFDAMTGEASIYLDGKRVAHRAAAAGSPITQGYVLQRYVQACQGRGAHPIKFNGGFYTVEPKASGMPYNPDWRNWGDCQWFQNLRHMYHPMLASGDFEMMEPFFRIYEDNRALAESRSKLYHGSQGAYFPETMTCFGTYSGGDYGWDRKGHQPNEVLCPWWDDAWNQGPELVGLMLDRWDFTRDEKFLSQRLLPMAESVLKYFDTRFKKDPQGRIVLDPTQVVETYWEGVVNDMPATAGLISITQRLAALPRRLVPADLRTFFAHMKKACPELPLQTLDGKIELAPAQKYVNQTSNVENGELYAVWPFRLVTLAHPKLLDEAKRAYAHRKNRLDRGWGYDGNVAALLGMTDEAARILQVHCSNSNPAYRWPATWGPNYDWLPDQNHGGNLLNMTDLMLMQAEPLEAGGAIRILPAWPRTWDVKFKLHAPGKTTVECETKDGRIVRLVVSPTTRAKDIVLPAHMER